MWRLLSCPQPNKCTEAHLAAAKDDGPRAEESLPPVEQLHIITKRVCQVLSMLVRQPQGAAARHICSADRKPQRMQQYCMHFVSSAAASPRLPARSIHFRAAAGEGVATASHPGGIEDCSSSSCASCTRPIHTASAPASRRAGAARCHQRAGPATALQAPVLRRGSHQNASRSHHRLAAPTHRCAVCTASPGRLRHTECVSQMYNSISHSAPERFTEPPSPRGAEFLLRRVYSVTRPPATSCGGHCQAIAAHSCPRRV